MFFFLQELFLSFCFSLNNSFLFRVTKVTEKGVACDKSVVFVVLRQTFVRHLGKKTTKNATLLCKKFERLLPQYFLNFLINLVRINEWWEQGSKVTFFCVTSIYSLTNFLHLTGSTNNLLIWIPKKLKQYLFEKATLVWTIKINII